MNIYVANIPYESSEGDVRALFERYGKVDSVRIILDRETQKSRGFAFVGMSDANEAEDAIANLNGYKFMGKSIAVKVANPKESKPRPTSRGSLDSNYRPSVARSLAFPSTPNDMIIHGIESIEDVKEIISPKRKKKDKSKKDKIEKGRPEFEKKAKKGKKEGKKYKRFGEDDNYYKIGKY